jgi:hypothetical protein
MRSKESAKSVSSRPTYCIELMISKHGKGGVGFTHGTRDPQDLALLGAAINKIANKNGLSVFVSEHPLDLGIAQLDQQSAKRIRISVNIADYVISRARNCIKV